MVMDSYSWVLVHVQDPHPMLNVYGEPDELLELER